MCFQTDNSIFVIVLLFLFTGSILELPFAVVLLEEAEVEEEPILFIGTLAIKRAAEQRDFNLDDFVVGGGNGERWLLELELLLLLGVVEVVVVVEEERDWEEQEDDDKLNEGRLRNGRLVVLGEDEEDEEGGGGVEVKYERETVDDVDVQVGWFGFKSWLVVVADTEEDVVIVFTFDSNMNEGRGLNRRSVFEVGDVEELEEDSIFSESSEYQEKKNKRVCACMPITKKKSKKEEGFKKKEEEGVRRLDGGG